MNLDAAPTPSDVDCASTTRGPRCRCFGARNTEMRIGLPGAAFPQLTEAWCTSRGDSPPRSSKACLTATLAPSPQPGAKVALQRKSAWAGLQVDARVNWRKLRSNQRTSVAARAI